MPNCHVLCLGDDFFSCSVAEYRADRRNILRAASLLKVTIKEPQPFTKVPFTLHCVITGILGAMIYYVIGIETAAH